MTDKWCPRVFQSGETGAGQAMAEVNLLMCWTRFAGRTTFAMKRGVTLHVPVTELLSRTLIETFIV